MKFRLLLLFLVLGFVCRAQSDSIPLIFKLNPFRVLSNEVQLSLEKTVNPRKSIEYTGGIIYPNPGLSTLVIGMFASNYYFYYGVTAGVGYRYYLRDPARKRSRVALGKGFVQLGTLYRYRRFEKQTYWEGGWSGSAMAHESLRSGQQHIVQPRFTYGVMNRSIEFNAGFGLNMIYSRDKIFGERFGGGEGYGSYEKSHDIQYPRIIKWFNCEPVFIINFKILMNAKKHNKG